MELNIFQCTDYTTQIFSNTVVRKFYTAHFQKFCLKFPVEYVLAVVFVYSRQIIIQIPYFRAQNGQA